MPNTKRLLAVVAAAALTIVPATGPAVANTADHAGLRTQQVWFTCPGETGISQLDGASTWSAETPPEGEACTSVDTAHHASSAEDTGADTVFHGSFTGKLDSLTVQLHLERLVDSDTVDLAVGLTVDDAKRVTWPTNVTAIPAEGSPHGVVEFSIHRLGLLDSADDVRHELTLTVSLRTGLSTGAWRWGSADMPSGITFHPSQLAETVIPATSGSEPPPDDPAALPIGPVIVAGPQAQAVGYLTPQMAMVPATTLTFGNTDQMAHDVTSRARGADGKPLFRATVTATGATSTVAGSDKLPAGTYDFYCSLHPNMTGTLHVAGELPAPHGGSQ